jgi:hypothetical protein
MYLTYFIKCDTRVELYPLHIQRVKPIGLGQNPIYATQYPRHCLTVQSLLLFFKPSKVGKRMKEND